MKKFENLGRSLSKDEQRNVLGGVGDGGGVIANLVGWEGPDSNGTCWCDFCNTASPGNVSCHNWCPASMCTSGTIDYNAWCLH